MGECVENGIKDEMKRWCSHWFDSKEDIILP